MGRLRDLLDHLPQRGGDEQPSPRNPAAERDRTLGAMVELGRRGLQETTAQLTTFQGIRAASSAEEAHELLHQLHTGIRRAHRRHAGILVLAAQRLAEPFAADCSLRDVLHRAMQQTAHPERVEARLPDRVVVRGRAVAAVTQLLTELIDNAVAYAPASNTTLVGGHVTGDGYVVVVQDCGVGLPDDEVHAVNQRLRTDPDDDLDLDEGLGFALVRRIARLHDIEVHVDAREGVGTTVEVIIPSLLLTRPRDTTPYVDMVVTSAAPPASRVG